MSNPVFVQPDDDDERTTVVDRSTSDDEHDGTVVVDRSAPIDDHDERTTVVDRSAPTTDDHDERTTVVDRSSPADDDDERTTVVDRSAPVGESDDGTVVVDRSAPADEVHDGTVVVPRPASEKSKSASRPAPSSRRGRRRITLPPVEPGFGPDAVDAVGAGAVDSYLPRAITPAPVATPAIPLGDDATRAPAPSMPSVERRSRRIGMIAVGGFAAACVISVVGLATIVVTLVG